jgi:hypothetical protein
MNRTNKETSMVLYTLVLYFLFFLALYLINFILILIFIPYFISSMLYLYMKRYVGFLILTSIVFVLSSFMFISAILPYITSEGYKSPLSPYILALIFSYFLFILAIKAIREMEIRKEPILPYLSLNIVLLLLLIPSIFITVETCDYILFPFLGVLLISLPFLILICALFCSKYPECSNERLAGLSLIPIFWGLLVLVGVGGPLLYLMVGTLCSCLIIFPVFLFCYMFGNLWIGFTFFLAYLIRERSTA